MSNLPNIPVSIADILIELTSPISAAEPGIKERLDLYEELAERPIMDASEVGKGMVVHGTHAGQPLIGGIVFRYPRNLPG
jgi:hypothetical protein